MIPGKLAALASEMENELRTDILPFWPRFADPEFGGFYGSIDNLGKFKARADKGLVMTARHLWTYSAAAGALKDSSFLATAKIAYDFLVSHLYDAEEKGFFWSVRHDGEPADRCKRIYGQAFAIYALSEHARAGGPRNALDLAMETFHLLERAARDPEDGGYFEAVKPDWSGPTSAALSAIDLDCPKSMNTNLHVMEALSALWHASRETAVRDALRDLIDIHLNRIMVSPGHLGLFFKKNWTSLRPAVSFGHDIEASWLITEAASAAWESPLPDRVRDAALRITSATAETLDSHGGSLPNEESAGHMDGDRIWWVQAEAIVGMVNAWQLSGDQAYLDRACTLWEFVKKSIIDREHGEWLWGAHENGKPLKGREKGGPWKASYHDGRACMEIMYRAAEGGT
jgi:mannobiose 2-epimerase